jgi:hypothetical protein
MPADYVLIKFMRRPANEQVDGLWKVLNIGEGTES